MRELPYVPTTGEVRDEYAKDGEYRDIAEGWFDAWLARERAEARREGQAEAFNAGWIARAERSPYGLSSRGQFSPPPPPSLNPYRNGADR